MKSTEFNLRDIYTISGTEVVNIYEKNKMAVHFQGMSKTLQFPQTVALQGAPTCSIGINPYGLYNRLNDAGRTYHAEPDSAVQFGSAPYIRIDDACTNADTEGLPGETELPDDIPALKNYYYRLRFQEKNVALTIATPSLGDRLSRLGKVKVIRRLISPLLSGWGPNTTCPLGAEEFEVENNGTTEAKEISLVVPRHIAG